MSASIDHATQLNGGVPLESTFSQDTYIDYIIDDDFGWAEMHQAPKYASTGLPNTLQPLTGGDFAQTQYSFIVNNRKDSSADGGAPPTGAYFENGINAEAGVIIADWNKSPRYTDLYIPGVPVSRMKQWSQAAFAQWLIQASARNVPIDSLKFVIRSWVTNGETQDQVFQALRSVGATEVPNFANRKVFSRTATDAAEADGFYTILGTPNGAGSGFLLATHKTELGVKRFKSVTVWNHPVAAPFGVGSVLKLMLSFEIEDVAQPTTG